MCSNLLHNWLLIRLQCLYTLHDRHERLFTPSRAKTRCCAELSHQFKGIPGKIPALFVTQLPNPIQPSQPEYNFALSCLEIMPVQEILQVSAMRSMTSGTDHVGTLSRPVRSSA